MAKDTARVKALAEALRRVFEGDVLDSNRPDYWTEKAAELIEEIEAEGLLLE